MNQPRPDIQHPPHNDDAERGLLGAALTDSRVLHSIVGELDAQGFYRERHRHIWRAMCALYRDGVEDLDPLTVADRLDAQGHREAVGGMSFLTRLSNEVPSAANAEQYADIVQKKSTVRRVISETNSVLQEARKDPDDPDNLVDEAIARLHEIDAEQGDSRLRSSAELGVEFQERAEDWQDPTVDTEVGLTTGYRDLDDKFRFEDSRLYIVAGRPGMGKSALVQNMQIRLSIDHDVPTALFSLEVSSGEVAARHICARSGLSSRRIKNGKLSEREFNDMMGANVEYQEAPIFVDDTPALSLPSFHAKTRRLHAEHGLGVVFIDYLQLMHTNRDHDIREQEIAALSRGLKRIAKDLEIPVVALAQLNRNLERRSDKRPKLADLRESGAIEQDADVVTFLYRDAVYNEDSPDKGTAEVIIGKNRDGPGGTVHLSWQEQCTRFDDLAPHRDF